MKLAEVSAHQALGTLVSFSFFTCYPRLATKSARESGLAAAIDLFVSVFAVGALVLLAGVLASWARDTLVARKVSTDARGLCLRILAVLDGGGG